MKGILGRLFLYLCKARLAFNLRVPLIWRLRTRLGRLTRYGVLNGLAFFMAVRTVVLAVTPVNVYPSIFVD